MKKILLTLAFLTIIKISSGQTVEETYPKTLWCPNDTFVIMYKNYPKAFPYKVSREDKTSPGTDASLNEYSTIYYGNDSLRLNYNNKLPYQHNFYINFESPKGKTTLRFHFNSISNYFDKNYITQNKEKVAFEIPEVYELANIIWTLSSSGKKAKDLNLESEYYKRIIQYFNPYLNHPIFKHLDFADSLYYKNYYDFRENSFAFNFKKANDKLAKIELLFNGPYYYVYGDELADSSLFGKLKILVEDFATKSRFRWFYNSNLNYYTKQIQRQRELLPVKQMWKWLEEQFPNKKYHSYKIIFSPLIGGSHSTQRYSAYLGDEYFGENVMFICNTDRVDKDSTLTEKQKEALMSGIVFTEIDHNYVNPSTNKYRKQVDSIFSNRDIWVRNSTNGDYYDNSVSAFNEYMTWAVFCLYIIDTYDENTANLVINERETRMVDKRNFIKFKEFDQALIKIRQEHKNLKVVDLYPLIIEWCKQQL
jgi:hypothetical protein